MPFDPIRKREVAEEFNLELTLRTSFDPARPMGNVAVHSLGAVIQFWLVGLHAEAAEILPKIVEWLDHGIKSDEDFGENRDFHRMRLHWAKAVATWMATGVHAEDHWKSACQLDARSWHFEKQALSAHQIVRLGLDDYMAFSIQAGDFKTGIHTYEQWAGATRPDLKKTRSPRKYGYALCLHRERGEFDDDTILNAGRKMLRAHLNKEWLGMGQSIRAVTWLKTVHWDCKRRDPRLTPLRTVLKAYEDMPDVPVPSFVNLDAV